MTTGDLDLAAFWAGPPPETEWIIRPWFVKGEIHTVIGNPGAGKSVLLLDLVIGLVMNAKVIAQTMQPGRAYRCLYFDADSGGGQTLKRVGFNFRGRGWAESPPPELANLFVRIDRDEGFDTRQSLALMAKAMDRVKPEVVVFDSLSGFTLEDESNRANISRIYRKILRPMADNGACIIVAHHERKTQGGEPHHDFISAARGSGEIAAASDTNLWLRESRGVHSLHYCKGRNLDRGEWPDPFHYIAIKDEVRMETRFIPVEAGATRAETLARLEVEKMVAAGPKTRDEIVAGVEAAIGVKTRTTDKVVAGLVASGRLLRGMDARQAVFSLNGAEP